MYDILGNYWRSFAVVNSQRTKPRGYCHHAGVNCCLLLPFLADCHSGPAEPAVRTYAQQRHHLVPAVPLAIEPERFCLQACAARPHVQNQPLLTSASVWKEHFHRFALFMPS